MRRLLAPKPDVTAPIRTLFREVLIPAIVPATEALEPLAREADLFLSHSIQLAAPAVAARTGVPWVSAVPAITCYPSGETPPPGIAAARPAVVPVPPGLGTRPPPGWRIWMPWPPPSTKNWASHPSPTSSPAAATPAA